MNKKVTKHKVFKREVLEKIFPEQALEGLDKIYSKVKFKMLVIKYDKANLTNSK